MRQEMSCNAIKISDRACLVSDIRAARPLTKKPGPSSRRGTGRMHYALRPSEPNFSLKLTPFSLAPLWCNKSVNSMKEEEGRGTDGYNFSEAAHGRPPWRCVCTTMVMGHRNASAGEGLGIITLNGCGYQGKSGRYRLGKDIPPSKTPSAPCPSISTSGG